MNSRDQALITFCKALLDFLTTEPEDIETSLNALFKEVPKGVNLSKSNIAPYYQNMSSEEVDKMKTKGTWREHPQGRGHQPDMYMKIYLMIMFHLAPMRMRCPEEANALIQAWEKHLDHSLTKNLLSQIFP